MAKPRKLLVATGNAGKLREFRQMLGADSFDWCDLASLDSNLQVEETGRTFRDNACLKANAYAKFSHLWTIADDSGLEVDALDGAPGVLSARWAEVNRAGRGDADNNSLLLRQLAEVPDERRAARFVCVLALARPDGRVIVTVRDTVEGRILREPRGGNGFGYDPLFLIDDEGRTTAELDPDHKNQISHRGKALRRMRDLMDRLGVPD
jgi:XTP/dITP diphosphohydrolase